MKNIKKTCVLLLCLLLCAFAAYGCKYNAETAGSGSTALSAATETEGSVTTAGSTGSADLTDREWSNRY